MADVPARPKVILAETQKDALVAEMNEENAAGLAEIEAYNAANPPQVKQSVKSAPKVSVKKAVKKKKPKVKKPKVKKKAAHHE
ncbi:MAG: hypothetical protein SFW65_03725 [Alphaproteobacteria bacterium]|nr:hypothetical protein [Alphaproteobacteria bacterium]